MMDFPGSFDSPDRIILMGLGDSEYCHHRISGILFDESIVIGNDLGNLAKDLACDLFDFFRVQLFGHSRISGKVREKDCNMLSFTFSCNFSWYGLFGWQIRNLSVVFAFFEGCSFRGLT
ncbi:MAG: hypothetical protein OET18_08980 [Desulfobacterales bacterium]|nr:hypothetical protein [Desulfobacterales bacterium]